MEAGLGRRRVGALAGAVLLLAGALLVGATGFTDTYRHHAVPDDDPEYGEEVAFEDLSPEAQDVVRRAVESDRAVYTSGPVSGTFSYPPRVTGQAYIIEYEDTTYVVSTHTDVRPVTLAAAGVQAGFGLAALALLVLGAGPLLAGAVGRGPSAESVDRIGRRWMPALAFAALLAPGLLGLGAFVLLGPLAESSLADVVPHQGVSLPALVGTVFLVGLCLATAGTVGFLRLTGLEPTPLAGGVLSVAGLWPLGVLGAISMPNTVSSTIYTIVLAGTVLVLIVGAAAGWELWHHRYRASGQ